MANPLDNYTFTPSTDAQAGTKSRFKWINDWQMAYICNQMDDCSAFLKAKNNQAPVSGVTGGGYLRQGAVVQVASNYWDSWMKKGSVRKVGEHKPNEPSVLDSPVTKVSFFDGGNFDGTEWKKGRGFVNGGGIGGGENQVASVRVPLGYRFLGFEHRMDSDDSTNGAGNTISADGPSELGSTQMQNNGMVDNITSYIVEQIPFDIEANWDRMTAGFIDPTDQAIIKANFCRNTSPSKLVGDRGDCKTILGRPEYNLNLVNKCAADMNNWIGQPQVISALKTIIRSSEEHSDAAITLFETYCRGDPLNPKSTGGHRTDQRCACINAADFGIGPGTSNCFDDGIKDFPGCKTTPYYTDAPVPHVGLYDKFFSIVSYPDKNEVSTALSSFNADSGCLVEACSSTVAGSSTSYQMLTTMQSPCRDVDMTFCGIPVNIGAAQDSPISITQNCGNGDGPSGTTATAGAPPGTPPGTPDTSETLWAADKIPGLDTKPKQIGFLFFIFIIICCCCMMILGVGVFAMNGGEPAAPNYSGNIAKLKSIASSI